MTVGIGVVVSVGCRVTVAVGVDSRVDVAVGVGVAVGCEVAVAAGGFITTGRWTVRGASPMVCAKVADHRFVVLTDSSAPATQMSAYSR